MRLVPTILVATAVAVCSYAVASTDDTAVLVRNLATAKISLREAIAIAEKHIPGIAIKAGYDHALYGWHYQIEVVSKGQIFEVRIDADSAKILSTTKDPHD